jgi:hypothetical protein
MKRAHAEPLIPVFGDGRTHRVLVQLPREPRGAAT